MRRNEEWYGIKNIKLKNGSELKKWYLFTIMIIGKERKKKNSIKN